MDLAQVVVFTQARGRPVRFLRNRRTDEDATRRSGRTEGSRRRARSIATSVDLQRSTGLAVSKIS